jgi:hypothetical protein
MFEKYTQTDFNGIPGGSKHDTSSNHAFVNAMLSPFQTFRTSLQSSSSRMHGARGGVPSGKANGRFVHGARTIRFKAAQMLMRICWRAAKDL